jgi:hypothetical protein
MSIAYLVAQHNELAIQLPLINLGWLVFGNLLIRRMDNNRMSIEYMHTNLAFIMFWLDPRLSKSDHMCLQSECCMLCDSLLLDFFNYKHINPEIP